MDDMCPHCDHPWTFHENDTHSCAWWVNDDYYATDMRAYCTCQHRKDEPDAKEESHEE